MSFASILSFDIRPITNVINFDRQFILQKFLFCKLQRLSVLTIFEKLERNIASARIAITQL